MSIRKILLIVVPIFLAAAAITYALLGGFREAEVALVEVEGSGYRLVGKPYRGTLKDPALNELLNEVGGLWEQGTLSGVLTVAILKEPVTDKDTVEQFIGVLLPKGEQFDELPPAYELLEVPAQQAVRASLQAHSSVWPSPNKLREEAEHYAREKGYELQPSILFEKYYGPGRLEVEVPLVQTSPAQE